MIGIAFHPIKQTKALLDTENILQRWNKIAALTVMIIGLVTYILQPLKDVILFTIYLKEDCILTQ